jgi:ABC-type uncharacterized transport system permease subunit
MTSIATIFGLPLVRATIRLTTPILLAALGGLLTSRAGVLNFALEGMMLLGAFLALAISYFVGSSWIGVVAAMAAGMALAAVFAFLFLQYDVDLVIMAIAINLLMYELTMFFLQTIFNVTGTFSDPSIQALPPIHIPVLRDIPVLGDILSGYNLIVYLSWVAVVACYVLLFRTRLGRHIRATGENLEAAQTAGINVNRVRMGTILASGALAGMAGAYLSVGHLTLFTHGMSAGRGWTGLTAALFGMNHPVGAFLTSLFFGAADAFALRLQGVTELPGSLVLMLPHILTVIAITVVGLREQLAETLGRRRFRARAAELLAQAQGRSQPASEPSQVKSE